MQSFLKEIGFIKKFPLWEELREFKSEKKIMPQDILDAVIFAISLGREEIGRKEKLKLLFVGEDALKKSLPRLEELGRYIAQIKEDSLFEIPNSDEIANSLNVGQPPHKYKAFEGNIYFLCNILECAEMEITRYLKEDCTYEMKLCRDICIRSVEYITAMLPDSLGYDMNVLKKDYTRALDSYMDKLAWENLCTNEHFSAHDFIDCWNISGFRGTEHLSNTIKKSLKNLNMPHICIFNYDWENIEYHNYTRNKIWFEYEQIVEFYLNMIASDSCNIRQVLWAVEGKKLKDNILVKEKKWFWQKRQSYNEIVEPILAGVLNGFKQYFEFIPPGNLWLELTNFFIPYDYNQFLLKKYPLATVERDAFSYRLKSESFETRLPIVMHQDFLTFL